MVGPTEVNKRLAFPSVRVFGTHAVVNWTNLNKSRVLGLRPLLIRIVARWRRDFVNEHIDKSPCNPTPLVTIRFAELPALFGNVEPVIITHKGHLFGRESTPSWGGPSWNYLGGVNLASVKS
jgi:hypothetical protein